MSTRLWWRGLRSIWATCCPTGRRALGPTGWTPLPGIAWKGARRFGFTTPRQAARFAAVGAPVPLLKERTEEYRQALHADAGDIPADYGIGEPMASGATPLPLPEHPKFRRHGGDRLAGFTRVDGRPVVTFDEGGPGRFFRFVFRRRGGAWIVSRWRSIHSRGCGAVTNSADLRSARHCRSPGRRSAGRAPRP